MSSYIILISGYCITRDVESCSFANYVGSLGYWEVAWRYGSSAMRSLWLKFKLFSFSGYRSFICPVLFARSSLLLIVGYSEDSGPAVCFVHDSVWRMFYLCLVVDILPVSLLISFANSYCLPTNVFPLDPSKSLSFVSMWDWIGGRLWGYLRYQPIDLDYPPSESFTDRSKKRSSLLSWRSSFERMMSSASSWSVSV